LRLSKLRHNWWISGLVDQAIGLLGTLALRWGNHLNNYGPLNRRGDQSRYRIKKKRGY